MNTHSLARLIPRCHGMLSHSMNRVLPTAPEDSLANRAARVPVSESRRHSPSFTNRTKGRAISLPGFHRGCQGSDRVAVFASRTESERTVSRRQRLLLDHDMAPVKGLQHCREL